LSDVNTFWGSVGGLPPQLYHGYFQENQALFAAIIDYLVSFSPVRPTTPTIHSADVTAAARDSEVSIYGDAFGYAGGTVVMDGMPATVLEWSPQRIRVLKPNALANGTIVATTRDGAASNVYSYKARFACGPLLVRIVAPGAST